MMNKIDFSWLAPHAIWYMPFCIFFCACLMYRYYRQQNAYTMLVGNQMNLLRNISLYKRIAKVFLLSVGMLCLFIALMRPAWDKSEEVIMQEGRDLYIALDISRSMLASDYKPNRLEFAKEKIRRLVKKLSCERVGLILFSGMAFVQCPLTSDYSAFYMYLDAVTTESISSGTTSLDKAILQALQSFESTPGRKNKLLVLFTDGEDFSHNLDFIKKEAIKNNLSIFTMGIGTPEGAPIPLFDIHGAMKGHQKDEKGSIVISRLDEDILRSLSRDVGGSYIRATDSDNDIFSFIKMVQNREKEVLGEQKISRFEDQYHYFLLVSFICFLFEWLL